MIVISGDDVLLPVIMLDVFGVLVFGREVICEFSLLKQDKRSDKESEAVVRV